MKDHQLILFAKMLRHVVLVLSLAAVARQVSAEDAPQVFDKQAYIKQYFKFHEDLQQNYTADLPSCKESFYSIQAVEKEADCLESQFAAGDNSTGYLCTPACFESLRFNGFECESEVTAVQSKERRIILEEARNGTLDAKHTEIIKSAILEAASSMDHSPNLTFLSTPETAKEFFSDEKSYALLEDLLGTEDGDKEYLKSVKECLATGSSEPPSPQPESSGVSSNRGYALSFAVVAGLCLMAW